MADGKPERIDQKLDRMVKNAEYLAAESGSPDMRLLADYVSELAEEVRSRFTGSERFTAYLDWASKEVATWPEWQRNVLGGPRGGT